MPVTTQLRVIDPLTSQWSSSVTLAQTDPALGIQSIGLSLTGTLDSSVSVQSSELGPSAFTAADQAVVTLAQPSGATLLADTARTSSTTPLAATGSPAGASTGSATAQTGSQTSPVSFYAGNTAVPAAALLIGTGQVTLPVTATTRVHAVGPGNLVANFTSDVAATVATQALTLYSPPGDEDPSSESDNIFLSLVDVPGSAIFVPAQGYTTPLTITQTVALPDQTTGSLSNLTFNGFDPALGQLSFIQVSIDADAVGTIAAENEDPVASSVSIGQAASVTLLGNDGTAIASSAVSLGAMMNLAAYDGTADDAGPSGFSTATSGSRNSAPVTTADWAQFISAQTVTFAALRTGATTIDGSGNLAVATTLRAGATVTVTYSYYPGGRQAVPAATPNVVGAGQVATYAAPSPAFTVAAGGTLLVPAGGFANAVVTVLPQGSLVVQSGGGIIGSNGTIIIGAATSNGIFGASLLVQAGGAISTATIGAGSVATIMGGAINLIDDGLVIVGAGACTGQTMVTGGSERVAGVATGSTVNSGGAQVVVAGGKAANTSVSGYGSIDVQSGGTANQASIGANGSMLVEAGGAAAGVTFTGPGATLAVAIGASAANVAGFAAGDTVDLIGLAYSAGLQQSVQALAGGGLTLTAFGVVATLAGSGLTPNHITLAADASGQGTDIVLDTPTAFSIGFANAPPAAGAAPITASSVTPAGQSLQFLGGTIYSSATTPGGQVQLLFDGILGRTPGAVTLGFYANAAQAYGVGAVATGLLQSAEGRADTAALSNADYVAHLYQGMLGRAPDAGGQAFWTGALTTGATRASVAAAIAATPEAQSVNAPVFAAGGVAGVDPGAVEALRGYETVLGRLPDAGGLTAFMSGIDSGAMSVDAAYQALVTSPEFSARLGGATDNASFVDLLEKSVYGAPIASGTQYWSGLLSAGQVTRGAVAEAFAHSPGADSVIAPLITAQGVAYA